MTTATAVHRLAVVVALAVGSLSAEKKSIEWFGATVISQQFDSQAAGVYAAPIGVAAIAVPIYRRSNIVVIENVKARITWSESFRRAPLVFPVNAPVKYYQVGNWVFVLDSDGKKHKFAVIGVVVKSPAQTREFPKGARAEAGDED